MELLAKGAIIEYSSWGLNPLIHIQLGEVYERVHQTSFFTLRDKRKAIECVGQKNLTQLWRLKSQTMKPIKCYVWNCHKKAVIFIELTTEPYDRMPCCQKHADQFPEHYPRVKTNKYGESLK